MAAAETRAVGPLTIPTASFDRMAKMKEISALFLASNPAGTTVLNLDEEIRAITEKIRASEHREMINLVSAWAVRPDDLIQSLNECRPQIVHFSGHGNQQGQIILTDNDRTPKPVSSAALKTLFIAQKTISEW